LLEVFPDFGNGSFSFSPANIEMEGFYTVQIFAVKKMGKIGAEKTESFKVYSKNFLKFMYVMFYLTVQ